MFDECGSWTPAIAYAYWVRPEQSKALGPAAPQAYGSPTCAKAVLTGVGAAGGGPTTEEGMAAAVPAGAAARAGGGVSATPAPASTATAARRPGRKERRN